MMRCPMNLKTVFSKDTLLNSYDWKKEITTYFRKTHIVFVCSHKYFILNNYSSISPNSTLVCFQIYSSLTISQIFHLKILVGVAAYAAIPVSQLSPLVQAEPSHKMCHLHIKAISHCSLSLNPQCHNTHSKSI